MILGVDASNIRAGGGITHLVELLREAKPQEHGFSRVVVWGGRETLARLEPRPWLEKRHDPLLDRALPFRVFWQWFRFRPAAAGCGLLFAPGGSYAGRFRPAVLMSQNLLPFEWREMRRYGWSPTGLRLLLLRFVQRRSFHRADGIVFLTGHARDAVLGVVRGAEARTAVIAHGVGARFSRPPRAQRKIGDCSQSRPFRILYVSIIDLYKHQWHAAEAVALLRARGFPVTLELAGPAYPPAMRRLRETIRRADPRGEFVLCEGPVAEADLPAKYAQADLCLFASSCETFGLILTEAMAAGLPIAASCRGAMPEVLGDAAEFFDPENPEDIARALERLIASPDLRARLARSAFERSRSFTWTRCAEETFSFLAAVAAGGT